MRDLTELRQICQKPTVHRGHLKTGGRKTLLKKKKILWPSGFYPNLKQVRANQSFHRRHSTMGLYKYLTIVILLPASLPYFLKAPAHPAGSGQRLPWPCRRQQVNSSRSSEGPRRRGSVRAPQPTRAGEVQWVGQGNRDLDSPDRTCICHSGMINF